LAFKFGCVSVVFGSPGSDVQINLRCCLSSSGAASAATGFSASTWANA